jgi:glycosyltransferase involved in cell wall biosynthesis
MGRPLRFCFLSIFYPPYSFGGDAIFVSRLANALARRGSEVDVIHCINSYNALAHNKPEQSFANHPNVTVHSLQSRLGLLSPLVAQQTGMTWPKTDGILRVFYSKKFDVIHYHNISLFGPQVLQLEPDYRDYIKLYTTHEHWLVCPMHVLWKNNERICDKPECLRCTLKFRRPPQLWRYSGLLEKCAASVDAFISPSLFTRRMHHERGFKYPMTVIPHFVPQDDEGASTYSSSPHPRPYFLSVGRLEKIKGVETLLPVFRRYEHADLLIAGTGSLEVSLRRQAAGMSNVYFLGVLPQERLREFYRHAIAVLVPSSGYEVLGLIILEAYLQRTPVIAHDLGALTEVVEQSQGGLLYRGPEELLAAMEQLRCDAQLRRQMGQRGYQACGEKWTESVHLEGYLRLVEETARRKLGFVPWERPARRPLTFPAASASGNEWANCVPRVTELKA